MPSPKSDICKALTSASAGLLSVLLLCGCRSLFWPGSRGTSEARRDVQRGIFAVKSYGYPVLIFWRYQQILEREYGIHAINLGCDPSVRNYVAGYNDVSKRAIGEHYGTNFLATI